MVVPNTQKLTPENLKKMIVAYQAYDDMIEHCDQAKRLLLKQNDISTVTFYGRRKEFIEGNPEFKAFNPDKLFPLSPHPYVDFNSISECGWFGSFVVCRWVS